MDIMRRIDQALAVTAEAYAKELEAEVARLREALITRQVWMNLYQTEVLLRIHPDDPMPRPTTDDYTEARQQLRQDGLLP